MTIHDDLRLDLPAYVAGELPDDEREKIDRHLSSCSDCKGVYHEIEEAARLAAVAPLEFQPPRALEARTFALIDLETPTAERGMSPTSRSKSKTGTGPRSWFRPRMILAPGMAAAFVAIALFSVSLWAQNSDLRDRLDQAQEETEPEGPSQLVELTSSDDRTDARATARLVHLGEDNYKIVLTTKDFPPPPLGYQYELWLGGDKGWVSAGSFNTVRPNMTFDLQVGVDPVTFPVLDLTLEKANGDPNRSGQEVMRGEVDITKLST
ncbi:MAG: anti-sigma factor [Actinomycetota bacterium]|nr:anti-sigma factor [Actinomycetota bacterium]